MFHGKSTISMAIFNSYVSLPEGMLRLTSHNHHTSSVTVPSTEHVKISNGSHKERERETERGHGANVLSLGFFAQPC